MKTNGRREKREFFDLGEMVVVHPKTQEGLCLYDDHFLPALTADLVVLPSLAVLSTDLMTPTATVCLMSRTANRPSGGYSEKVSTHIG